MSAEHSPKPAIQRWASPWSDGHFAGRTIGATAAVHNAIVDAVSSLGVAHIELPCTADRVWDAICSASHFDS